MRRYPQRIVEWESDLGMGLSLTNNKSSIVEWVKDKVHDAGCVLESRNVIRVQPARLTQLYI